MPETVQALHTTTAAMTGAQKDLTTALRNLSDRHGGVVAQIESANSRLTYSLESRAKTVDALLRELKNDVLRIWVPIVAGAAILIGLFTGIGIQNWRDSAPTTVATPPPIAIQTAPMPQSERNNGGIKASRKPHAHNRQETNDSRK